MSDLPMKSILTNIRKKHYKDTKKKTIFKCRHDTIHKSTITKKAKHIFSSTKQIIIKTVRPHVLQGYVHNNVF